LSHIDGVGNGIHDKRNITCSSFFSGKTLVPKKLSSSTQFLLKLCFKAQKSSPKNLVVTLQTFFKDPKSALWKLLHLQISVFSFYQVIKNIHMQYVTCLNLLWKNKILLETLFQRSKRALLQNSVVTLQNFFKDPKALFENSYTYRFLWV
jgi:hypothetical protein